MSDKIPYFFFSYSRKDDDDYLKKFFKSLVERVAFLTGVHETHTVGFRDEQDVTAGDDWNSEISAAVQISKVLVCIYTPRFFSKRGTHEYCAKEFAAFLKRNPQTRYVPVPDDEGQPKYQIRGARNILPVLWIGEKDLVGKPNNLPPHRVRSIQYTINGLGGTARDYYAKGMRSIAVRHRSITYDEIITRFAQRIIELSLKPLPSLAPPPTFQELWNAFWADPEGVEPLDDPPPGPPGEAIAATPAAPSLGPGQMLAIEVRSAPDYGTVWTPYKGGPGLAAAVEEISYDRQLIFDHVMFDPGADDFVAKAWLALEDATAKQATPILFVDPGCLQVEEHRSALIRLLRRQWRGGLIIPVDHDDKDTVRLVENTTSFFDLSATESKWIIVQTSIGTMTEFRTSVNSVVDGILGRIVNYGEVKQKPSQNAGPDTRPELTNILNSEIARL